MDFTPTTLTRDNYLEQIVAPQRRLVLDLAQKLVAILSHKIANFPLGDSMPLNWLEACKNIRSLQDADEIAARYEANTLYHGELIRTGELDIFERDFSESARQLNRALNRARAMGLLP